MNKKPSSLPMHVGHVDVDKVMQMNTPYSPVLGDFDAASKEERENYIPPTASVSYWKDAWRRLRKNRVAMVALCVIIFLFIACIFGPMFMDLDYSTQIRGEENWPPVWEQPSEKLLAKAESKGIVFDAWKHPLGSDNLGRDNLARLLYGTRISLAIGLVASLIVLVIGSLYGAIAGYIGGMVDTIMMRVVDIIYSVPDVLIVLLLASTLKGPITTYINTHNSWISNFLSTIGPNLIGIFITFGMLYWVGMSRIIRGQVLMLKQNEYVTAARALGASDARIIRKHLLPNCIGQLIVTTCLQIPSAIFLESFLSFLGMGVSAPLTSLGSLASEGLSGIYSYTYRLIVPSAVLSILILSFNLFGDGLRDALDPRLKK